MTQQAARPFRRQEAGVVLGYHLAGKGNGFGFVHARVNAIVFGVVGPGGAQETVVAVVGYFIGFPVVANANGGGVDERSATDQYGQDKGVKTAMSDREYTMDLDALAKMVLHGDHIGAEQWTVEALAETVEPKAIIDGALIPGMDEVGRRFKGGEYHLPEVLIAARAMKASLKHVRPLLSEADGPSIGRVVIGTVQGDLHDIGKNLVSMMLEGAGFEVLDLGVDVSPEAFVEAAEDEDTRLVCLSTLLTTTMPKIAETVKALDAAELRSGLKVMVGGAPVDQVFTDQIKADGYATDAPAAVELAKSLLGVGETS